jgi:hypothetical protein
MLRAFRQEPRISALRGEQSRLPDTQVLAPARIESKAASGR